MLASSRREGKKTLPLRCYTCLLSAHASERHFPIHGSTWQRFPKELKRLRGAVGSAWPLVLQASVRGLSRLS